VIAGFGAVTVAVSLGDQPSQRAGCPLALSRAHDLGTLAFLRDGKLDVLDVRTCRTRTLARAPAREDPVPVSFSADGRFISFGASIVPAGGGRVLHPLAHVSGEVANQTIAWAPSGHVLVGVTRGGGVVIGGPGTIPRRLLPDGFGASSVAFSPSGRSIAASRSLFGKARAAAPYHQGVWLIDLRTGRKREILHLARSQLAPPLLYGFTPDSRWVLAWEDTENSASLRADGLPLVAAPVNGRRAAFVGNTLVYRDFLCWSGETLFYVINHGGRMITLGDKITTTSPPRWAAKETPGSRQDSTHSYVSPTCSEAGRRAGVAAAVGPVTEDTPLGHERRSIWLLAGRGGWRALEPPPPRGATDELPMFSRDGRWIAFIRTTTIRRGAASGQLYVLDLGAQPTGTPKPIGPLADVGTTSNYYGHYGWANTIAWRTP
jgi:hypothetical protein